MEYAGAHRDEQRLLASILDDQFLLARAVLDPEPEDVAAREQLRDVARA